MSEEAVVDLEAGGMPPEKTHLSKKSLTMKLRSSPYNRKSPKVRELLLGKNDESQISLRRRSLGTRAPVLLFKSWRTFKVTPLFEFCYTREKFQEYARHLSSYIEMEKKKNSAVLLDHEHQYKVSISVLRGVNVSQADDKAVSIIIEPKIANADRKPLFSCVLMSVERKKDAWEHKLKDKYFTVLPLLLTSGGQLFLKAVVKFLEEKFCCIIQPISFSCYQLMWMLSMWAGCTPEIESKPLFMEYKLPYQNLDTIQYSISANSVYKIWNQIHDPNSNDMDIDEVQAFIDALQKHFKELFAVDLTQLQLSSIGTSVAAVHKNGITKLLNTTAVHYVLRHLTNLAQERSLA